MTAPKATDLILYTTEDGKNRIQLRADGHTVWLTQLEMAELFNATKQNISLHLQNIFADGELDSAATVKDSLTVQLEGTREVRCAFRPMKPNSRRLKPKSSAAQHQTLEMTHTP